MSAISTQGTGKVAVVIVSPVSMSGIGAIVDTFALVNELTGGTLFQVDVYSREGIQVVVPGGANLPVGLAFDDSLRCDWLIVIGERFHQSSDDNLFLSQLFRVVQRTALVIGIQHGVWWLARTGQLSGYRVSVHWSFYQQFVEQFECLIKTRQIFEIDRDRATCAGGRATVDFLLELICREHGRALSERVAEILIAAPLRVGDEQQRGPLQREAEHLDSRLRKALQLMASNLEDPLPLDEIARSVGVSRRHLERMFQARLGSMPSKHYLALRLAEARSQVQRTGKSMMQISLSCGFSSAAHFSNVYRERFGLTPREDRRKFVRDSLQDRLYTVPSRHP
ncbi:GlxA family transcriptional regulator [Paraburkholderia sp. BR13439]|uniref:GlxA family transcriptional regulator n=1 Tax=unclassified Paraburkholderia TaxID=2615204 RepID=UPI0034CDB4D8